MGIFDIFPINKSIYSNDKQKKINYLFQSIGLYSYNTENCIVVYMIIQNQHPHCD